MSRTPSIDFIVGASTHLVCKIARTEYHKKDAAAVTPILHNPYGDTTHEFSAYHYRRHAGTIWVLIFIIFWS
jgi:hypothetical protein